MLGLVGLAVAARTECAAVDSAPTPADALAAGRRLFEVCCAYEQVWADLALTAAPSEDRRAWHATARAFGALATELAGHVLFGMAAGGVAAAAGRCREEVSAADRLVTPDLDRREAYVNPAECFTRDLTDLDGYAAFARRHATALAGVSAVVVGIRTSGSYLAPIWAAALRAEGRRTVTVTARPRRSPRVGAGGRFVDPAAGDVWIPPEDDDALLRTVLGGWDVAGTAAIVVDDLAFTGSSFVRVDNYLTGLGIAGGRTVFAQSSPLNPALLTPDAAARLAARRPLTAPARPDGPVGPGAPARRFFADLAAGVSRDIRVTGAELAPPTFAQRHLAARTIVPASEYAHFTGRGRDRHHLLEAELDGRPTRLFAKVFGVGHLADREVELIRGFGDGGYQVVAHVGGFLLYEWIPGRPLGPDEAEQLDDEDVDRLAAYAATVRTLYGAGRVDGTALGRAVTDRVRRVSPVDDATLAAVEKRAAAAGPAAVVEAPRNQGHWHHIRGTDGRLRRVHLDLGEWSWTMDPAEELAAAVLELGLSAEQRKRLVAGFAARTGDDCAEARLSLGTVSYAARVLDSYRFWDGQVAQTPERYRRPADHPSLLAERARVDRFEAALHSALAEVVDGG